jgi:hypothetical protein
MLHNVFGQIEDVPHGRNEIWRHRRPLARVVHALHYVEEHACDSFTVHLESNLMSEVNPCPCADWLWPQVSQCLSYTPRLLLHFSPQCIFLHLLCCWVAARACFESQHITEVLIVR